VKRLSTVLSVAAIFGLTLLPSNASDGTRVTSGAMHFEDTVGGITLEGQSGFRMEAGVDVTGGVYDPWNQCSFPECQPGTEVSLFAHWIGLDLNGTVSLRGKTYVLGQEGEGGAFGSVEFDGSVILPEFTGSGTAEVSAPFLFSGQVAPDNPSGLIEFEPISGSGIATLFLSIGYDGTSWSVDRATYEFHRTIVRSRARLDRRHGSRGDCQHPTTGFSAFHQAATVAYKNRPTVFACRRPARSPSE
jgi:hypothetical protein